LTADEKTEGSEPNDSKHYQIQSPLSGVDYQVRLMLGACNCSCEDKTGKLAGDVDSAHEQNAFEGQEVAIRLSTTACLFATFPLFVI
jgi:hypothetical protein